MCDVSHYQVSSLSSVLPLVMVAKTVMTCIILQTVVIYLCIEGVCSATFPFNKKVDHQLLLYGTGVAGIALASHLFDNGVTDVMNRKVDKEVLIFGAGITGITLARQLVDNGITDIMVLEARSDKIGGRIRSETFAGVTIELGANWIQQVYERESERDKHPIWKLAKDTPGCPNITGHFTNTREVWDRNTQGQYTVVDDYVVKSLLENYDNSLERISELSYRLQEKGESDITCRKAFDEVGYIPSTPLEELIEWYKFNYLEGSPPNMTSLFAYYPYNAQSELGDLNYFVSDQTGFASILDCIAKGIESKIQLGAMVNSISWNDDRVCASVTIDSQEQTMCGKYGVVTFSIGVLQDWIQPSESKFTPSLSSNKMKAINAHGLAYYLKIFLKFEETFWNDNFDDILRTSPRRGYLPLFSPIGQLLPGSPGILIVTAIESEAYRLTYQDPNITKEEIMVVLRELYGNSIPYPTDILIPSWISDPLYKGMYGYSRFGLTLDDLSNLNEPEGNLYFSGEALDTVYTGYVHGGYCNALSIANRILGRENVDIETTGGLPPCP